MRIASPYGSLRMPIGSAAAGQMVPSVAIVAAVLGPTVVADWLHVLLEPGQRQRLD